MDGILKNPLPVGRDFGSMHADSRTTELRIQEYFRKHGYTVIDHADSEFYRSIGVGFEICDPKRWMFRVEIKDDHRIYETDNIFIEDTMQRKTGFFDGWMHYCVADIICYHDHMQDKGYLLDWRKLRAAVRNYNPVQFYNVYDNCIGYGYLVPLSDAMAGGFVMHTYQLS